MHMSQSKMQSMPHSALVDVLLASVLLEAVAAGACEVCLLQPACISHNVFVQAPISAAQADQSTMQWLQACNLNEASVKVVSDPEKGYTEHTLKVCGILQICNSFPQLSEGQRLLLQRGIEDLKRLGP